MEYELRAFFKENDDTSVKGFVVIEINEQHGTYRLAEKWLRDDGSSKWVAYQVPESQLLDRLDDDLCEHAGSVTEEQFEQVCENTDPRSPLKVAAPA